MPATSTIAPTGNAYLDGILLGEKWAVSSLTYSFPADALVYSLEYGSGEAAIGFEALNPAQQATVRTVLDAFASVANLTFTEVADETLQAADLRLAESDAPRTAWAYYPAVGEEGGDAWFNNSRNFFDAPEKGDYAYFCFMHEIGHALGLKHAHETIGLFGALPAQRNSMEYTVMSYSSYVGASVRTGYSNEDFGHAQSLMMYDIAALQHLYGANYATNGGDTTYSWSPTTGEMFIGGVGQGAPGANRIFLTVWDGGGDDTYDFTNYRTSVIVDLRPGSWTTTASAQLARLRSDGSELAAGNIANALLHENNPAALIENAIGGSGGDTMTGNAAANALSGGAGNDTLKGGAGRDVLDGGTGADYADFRDKGAAVSVALNGQANATVTVGGVAEDFIRNIENLLGGSAGDSLSGDGFSNVLYGRGGDDILRGGLGRDTIQGDRGTDTADFRDKTASIAVTLNGSSYATVKVGGLAEDTFRNVECILGGSGNDNLGGDGLANSLYGYDGNDVLQGGGGADWIVGGRGADDLDAGPDNARDVFVFQSVRDSGTTSGSFDQIYGFDRKSGPNETVCDTIRLRGIDAGSADGDQAFRFVSTFTAAAGSEPEGQVRIADAGTAVNVYVDVNGDSRTDMVIQVMNVEALTRADFLL